MESKEETVPSLNQTGEGSSLDLILGCYLVLLGFWSISCVCVGGSALFRGPGSGALNIIALFSHPPFFQDVLFSNPLFVISFFCRDPFFQDILSSSSPFAISWGTECKSPAFVLAFWEEALRPKVKSKEETVPSLNQTGEGSSLDLILGCYLLLLGFFAISCVSRRGARAILGRGFRGP